MFTYTITTCSEEETASLAQKMAEWMCVGDVIRLSGDLGAGKSVFARGLIHGLGHQGSVPSPTFTIISPYDQTRLPVLHMDAYRLEDADELAALDIDPWREHGVLIVEWPEKVAEAFPPDAPDVLDYYWPTMDNAGTLSVFINERAVGREIKFQASDAWFRRLARVFPELKREMSEEGRSVFLKQQSMEGFPLSKASPGDWSGRSYWRVETDKDSMILMDAPPPLEEVPPIPYLTNYYANLGIRVPQVSAVDEKKGYMLVEDFGQDTLIDAVQKGEDPTPWLRAAVDVLLVMANNLPPEGRTATATDLWLEVARFTDHTLPLIKGHATAPEDRAAFHTLLKPIIDELLALPQVSVHWDFHANNFLPLGEEASLESFGLIDFQDTHTGPLFYDLATIVKNDRLPIGPDLEKELVTRYCTGLSGSQHFEEKEAWRLIHLIVMQRTFKIIGGACKLSRQTGRTDILSLMPRLQKMLDFAFEEPALAEIAQWFGRMVPDGLQNLHKK